MQQQQFLEGGLSLVDTMAMLQNGGDMDFASQKNEAFQEQTELAQNLLTQTFEGETQDTGEKSLNEKAFDELLDVEVKNQQALGILCNGLMCAACPRAAECNDSQTGQEDSSFMTDQKTTLQAEIKAEETKTTSTDNSTRTETKTEKVTLKQVDEPEKPEQKASESVDQPVKTKPIEKRTAASDAKDDSNTQTEERTEQRKTTQKQENVPAERPEARQLKKVTENSQPVKSESSKQEVPTQETPQPAKRPQEMAGRQMPEQKKNRTEKTKQQTLATEKTNNIQHTEPTESKPTAKKAERIVESKPKTEASAKPKNIVAEKPVSVFTALAENKLSPTKPEKDHTQTEQTHKPKTQESKPPVQHTEVAQSETPTEKPKQKIETKPLQQTEKKAENSTVQTTVQKEKNVAQTTFKEPTLEQPTQPDSNEPFNIPALGLDASDMQESETRPNFESESGLFIPPLETSTILTETTDIQIPDISLENTEPNLETASTESTESIEQQTEAPAIEINILGPQEETTTEQPEPIKITIEQATQVGEFVKNIAALFAGKQDTTDQNIPAENQTTLTDASDNQPQTSQEQDLPKIESFAPLAPILLRTIANMNIPTITEQNVIQERASSKPENKSETVKAEQPIQEMKKINVMQFVEEHPELEKMVKGLVELFDLLKLLPHETEEEETDILKVEKVKAHQEDRNDRYHKAKHTIDPTAIILLWNAMTTLFVVEEQEEISFPTSMTLFSQEDLHISSAMVL